MIPTWPETKSQSVKHDFDKVTFKDFWKGMYLKLHSVHDTYFNLIDEGISRRHAESQIQDF